MLRGYRFLIAAFGLILLGAGPPKIDGQQPPQGSSTKIEKSLEGIAASIQQANEPSDLEQPCKEGDNKRSSDLCAQWKAADAADSAARAAWIIGSIGALIGALTLAAAAAAAHFARKAAIETEKGANAAIGAVEATQTANNIAQDSAQRQLRAYVSAESARIEVWQDGGLNHIRLEIILHNSGATTATVIRKKAKFQSGDWNSITDRREQTIISPQGREPITVECGTGGVIESLNIIARMFIEYRDYLGEIHTEDSFWAAGPSFAPPIARTNFVLICHSKIDETIGRFLDPAGEEADARQWQDAISRFQQWQDGRT